MRSLKKAYADIILNMAKEAAARILISERKALRFQQQLFSAKEEALNTLLRFKQNMDFKIVEAERAALSQRRRAQELEAQLNEAEDIVLDLRLELKRIRDKLESMKNNLTDPLYEQNVEGNSNFDKGTCQGNELGTSNSIECTLVSGPGQHITSDIKVTPSNQKTVDEHCDFVFENAIPQTGPSNNLCGTKYFSKNLDLASLTMRSKEPELYGNGCTQRIRAVEQNLRSVELPVSRESDDQYSYIKDGSVREDEPTNRPCAVASPLIHKTVISTQKFTGSKGTVQDDSICDQGQVLKFFHRFSSRKQRTCKHIKATTCDLLPDLVMAAREPSNAPCLRIPPFPGNKMTESGEQWKEVGEAQKDLNSHFAPILFTQCITSEDRKKPIDVPAENENFENLVTEADCEMSKTKNEVPGYPLIRSDYEVIDTSDVSICKMNLKKIEVPLKNPNSRNDKTSETNGVPIQAANDRLLKYTFQRKRKREYLSSSSDTISLEKKTLEGTGDKPSTSLEPQESSLVMESPRANQRLVRVTRQLISLSEKRW